MPVKSTPPISICATVKLSNPPSCLTELLVRRRVLLSELDLPTQRLVELTDHCQPTLRRSTIALLMLANCLETA